MKINAQTFAHASQQIGMVLMTTAVTVGLLELPDHPKSRVVLPTSQPAFAFAELTDGANPVRREREEGAPHYISYSIAQRTPGRSGRI